MSDTGVPGTDWLPFSTRAHWMRRASDALVELVSPCPFYAFGTVIVNHTSSDGLGELICIGANGVRTGNPTLHGEIAAINNCSAVLADPNGPFNLSPAEALAAFRDLTLYTTAEPCAMCSSAIRWAGFRECVYGTSIAKLTDAGFGQIQVPSAELFRRSSLLTPGTTLVEHVLRNETDPYFEWQYHADAPCPRACKRDAKSESCVPVQGEADDQLQRQRDL